MSYVYDIYTYISSFGITLRSKIGKFCIEINDEKEREKRVKGKKARENE